MILKAKISANVTLQDLCLSIYNTLDAMYDLINRNPFLNGLDYNDIIFQFAGQEVFYDSNLVVKQAVQLNYVLPTTDSNIGYINGLQGQSIYDLVAMTYGSLDYW